MSNVRRHPASLVNATKAYTKVNSSSVRFLIDENERMAKELQADKQGEEQVTTSSKAELRKGIIDEVSSLKTVMRKLYFSFITMHNSDVHLNDW